MNVIKYPDAKQIESLIQRPSSNTALIQARVREIMLQVKQKGDKALLQYARDLDKVSLKNIRVSVEEIKAAKIDKQLQRAIGIAYKNVYKFHQAQVSKSQKIETTSGVICWRESRAIEHIGLYIPGGSAPLFSTVLMLGIPAQIAGCKSISLCSPAGRDGKIHPAILYTANLCGITNIYKAGGAQAIAAMAYGTGSIMRADKIFGPGNQYVTLAKQFAQQEGIAIDMPAGPSEVLVLGDESCNPAFVAADLLSQAEHGPDSQVIFIALHEKIINPVLQELEKQLKQLPRKEIAVEALEQSKIILVKNKAEAVAIINQYAPEHLIVAVKDENYFLKNVINAGSVFIGNYTPESAGDYASGTNHTLPTNGFARSYSGVSVDSFVKKITYQKISKKGISKLGPTIECMASAEGLHAHKNAVSIRIKKLKN
jgi:histidinol dehydrogenase